MPIDLRPQLPPPPPPPIVPPRPVAPTFNFREPIAQPVAPPPVVAAAPPVPAVPRTAAAPAAAPPAATSSTTPVAGTRAPGDLSPRITPTQSGGLLGAASAGSPFAGLPGTGTQELAASPPPVAQVALPGVTGIPAAAPPTAPGAAGGSDPYHFNLLQAPASAMPPISGTMPSLPGPEQSIAPEPADAMPGGGAGFKIEGSGTLNLLPKLPEATRVGGEITGGVNATAGLGIEQEHGLVHYTGFVRAGTEGGISLGMEPEKGKMPPIGIEHTEQNGIVGAFEIVAPEGTSFAEMAGVSPTDLGSLPDNVQVKIDLANAQVDQTSGRVLIAPPQFQLSATGEVTTKTENGLTWQAQSNADGSEVKTSVGTYGMQEDGAKVGLSLAGLVEGSLGGAAQNRTNWAVESTYEMGPGGPKLADTQLVTAHEHVLSSSMFLGAGPVEGEWNSNDSSGLTNETINPDGSRTKDTTLYYDRAVPMKVSQTFNPDGTEQVAARTYDYTVSVDSGNRELLHNTLGGDPTLANRSPIGLGDTVVLRFDQSSMARMQNDFRMASQTNPIWEVAGLSDYRVQGMDDSMSFAVGMVRAGPSMRTDQAFTEVLSVVANERAKQSGPLVQTATPAEAWVFRPNVSEGQRVQFPWH